MAKRGGYRKGSGRKRIDVWTRFDKEYHKRAETQVMIPYDADVIVTYIKDHPNSSLIEDKKFVREYINSLKVSYSGYKKAYKKEFKEYIKAGATNLPDFLSKEEFKEHVTPLLEPSDTPEYIYKTLNDRGIKLHINSARAALNNIINNVDTIINKAKAGKTLTDYEQKIYDNSDVILSITEDELHYGYGAYLTLLEINNKEHTTEIFGS